MTSDLHALLARVEAAEGPDRELDAELWLRFTPGATRKATTVNHPKGAYVIDETRENFRLIIVPAFTASLDASLALCERVLPGRSGLLLYAALGPLVGPDRSASSGQIALALLAALLRAKIAQTEPTP